MAASNKLSIFFIAFILSLILLNPLSSVQSSEGAIPPTGHSASDFPKHLEGCHKGQKVKGLYDLKRYLMKFGYIDSGSLTEASGDEFDDLLESAVKKYQENYHLKVTGTLDHDTLGNLMLPRCGNPDVIINVTSSKKKHGRQSKFFHMTAHYEFFEGRPRWQKTSLTYSFRSSASVAVSEQVLREVCSRAFKRWQDVSQFTFQEAPQGVRGDLEIGFHRGNHGDGSQNAFDGRGDMFGNVFAHAFQPTIGSFHYDADENWSDNPTSRNELDLESVAVHEIGHLLGLHHSNVAEAIMYSTFQYGAIKRDLNSDDIEGIRVLYST